MFKADAKVSSTSIIEIETNYLFSEKKKSNVKYIIEVNWNSEQLD